MEEDDLGTTQPSTQPVPGSQSFDSQFWGRLTPCLSPTLPHLDFWKNSNRVMIGRALENDIVLPGFRVSNKHAIFYWNGGTEVVLEDLSSNGTYVRRILSLIVLSC